MALNRGGGKFVARSAEGCPAHDLMSQRQVAPCSDSHVDRHLAGPPETLRFSHKARCCRMRRVGALALDSHSSWSNSRTSSHRIHLADILLDACPHAHETDEADDAREAKHGQHKPKADALLCNLLRASHHLTDGAPLCTFGQESGCQHRRLGSLSLVSETTFDSFRAFGFNGRGLP